MDSLGDYLTKLASSAPAPGGGSAAMVVGAAGCSLLAMTARICAGSKKYALVHDLASRIVPQADGLREQFQRLREEDEKAYMTVVAARGDDAKMQNALAQAAAVPLEGARTALAALRLTIDALSLGNPYLVSDVGCAAEFAHAALLGCAYNVRVNLQLLKNRDVVIAQRLEVARLQSDGAVLLSRARSALTSALGT